MSLRWEATKERGIWQADVAKDSSGKEVARIQRRGWPELGMKWDCLGQSGTARNVTDAKRAVLTVYVRSGAP